MNIDFLRERMRERKQHMKYKGIAMTQFYLLIFHFCRWISNYSKSRYDGSAFTIYFMVKEISENSLVRSRNSKNGR